MSSTLTPRPLDAYRQTKRRRAAEAAARRALRREAAWTVACEAADLLRSRYGVTRVLVFGSLVQGTHFDERSDVDLRVRSGGPERMPAPPARRRPGGRQTAVSNGDYRTVAGRIRPPVISEQAAAALDRYRGFRHVIRNVHAYALDPQRVAEPIHGLPPLLARLRAESAAFADVLDAIARA
jgi:hypothetical protein